MQPVVRRTVEENAKALIMSTETLTFPDVSLDARFRPGKGPIRLGSEEHRNLFCHALLSTFDPYRPESIVWPDLSPEEHRRLTSLPIWNVAVDTEEKAGLRVAAYGERVTDPVVKKAIALNAFEERRHKRVLHHMVESYGITLELEPEYVEPRDAEWAFMLTGYSECVDSFFAFGLFEIARRSGYFPPKLVDAFEVVMREEGRHILFFVNWLAWHRRNMSRIRRVWFSLKTMAVWAFLIGERIGVARNMDASAAHEKNFTMNGSSSIGVDVSIAELMDVCLSENDRRLGAYDERLVRPRAVPRLVRLARRFMRRRKPSRR